MPELRITMRPPGLAERLWRKRLGLALPAFTGSSGPRSAKWVRLLPYRWRRVHRWYAARLGFYWLPCPLCGAEFGGHEAGGNIPAGRRGCSRSVCSACTRLDGFVGQVG